MKNLYVIGPVTGIPNDNRPAFEQARHDLKAAGYYVQIPHDYIASGLPWNWAMMVSIRQLVSHTQGDLDLDGVAALPGWEQSKGARLEAQVAEAIGLPVKTVSEWVEVARHA